jgi:Na+-driven multidrug efflux pump
MTDDVKIIEYGAIRIVIMGSFQFVVGVMNVFANVLRGMGKNLSTMITSLLCTCVFRILWMKTFYLLAPSLEMLYAVYPISWALCAICYVFLAFPALKKEEKKFYKEMEAKEEIKEQTVLEQ